MITCCLKRKRGTKTAIAVEVFIRKLYICLVFAGYVSVLAAEESIRYFQTDLRYAYRIELLQLALDKTTESYGGYKLQPFTDGITQGRGVSLLKQGNFVNVAFLPTNVEREHELLAVKIPILRGILGYRVLLVHRQDVNRFKELESVKMLSERFLAGFGAHWADMAILEANGLRVEGVSRYESLLEMLNAHRFEYFPRGINEAWNEIAKYHAQFPNIVVEPEIALYYPYPVYFFVSRNNPNLAARLEAGLTTAISDGSFKALFEKYHQHLFEQANLKQRKVFVLKNPFLPIDTALPNTDWWLPVGVNSVTR